MTFLLFSRVQFGKMGPETTQFQICNLQKHIVFSYKSLLLFVSFFFFVLVLLLFSSPTVRSSNNSIRTATFHDFWPSLPHFRGLAGSDKCEFLRPKPHILTYLEIIN